MIRPIKDLDKDELSALMRELSVPAFRAKQLYEWLYIHHASSYDEMSNVPKALRETLTRDYPLYIPELYHKAQSSDGTRKYVFRLFDGNLVEAVGMPALNGENHLSVCFSTQVGCAMECAFCATGKEGFTRNLSIGEMVDQVLLIQEDFGARVSHLVAMGQGEPFLNYRNVVAALRILNDKIKDREIEKFYLCAVTGTPKPSSGRLENYLFKDAKKNQVYVKDKPMPGAKPAATEYRVICTKGRLSLVECRLLTGRTHQIRVQMAHAGWPLLGDGKYGRERVNREYGEKGQALYSYRLRFDFPTDAGILNYLRGREFAVESVDFAEKYFGIAELRDI